MTASPSTSASPVTQALILAGGQATRLRPYTDTRPKAMVEVAGRPIIDYQLEWLASHGVEQVVVSAGCGWYIERLLAERQVEVPVIASPGRLVPGGGLEMTLPKGSPFFSPQTGIDKKAVVRPALAN
jgi:NDP-sugar pyrophosphorylase family protein